MRVNKGKRILPVFFAAMGGGGWFHPDGAVTEPEQIADRVGDFPIVGMALAPLMELALDLRWNWNHAAIDLWRQIDPPLWEASGNPVLIHTPHALDEWVLRRMSEDGHIGPDVAGTRKVRRLWDVARLPDFRKLGPEGHARLVLGLAETLMDPDARLSNAGMERRLAGLNPLAILLVACRDRASDSSSWRIPAPSSRTRSTPSDAARRWSSTSSSMA